ncbi:MAG TPA: hypothetical protein VHI71_07950 [Actinomycetota bacterium]|nr:hypothetical protein [Actinomycetota bacterium]
MHRFSSASRAWSRGAAALVALVVAAAGPTAAHERTSLDGDDSRGPLDVVVARIRHREIGVAGSHGGSSRSATELRLRLVTYDKWGRKLLNGDRRFIAFEFDLDDDKRIERCLVVKNGEEELTGRVYRGCYRRMEPAGRTSVSRPDRHSIHTTIDKRRLGRRVRTLEWRVTTSFEVAGAGEDGPCAATGGSPSDPYGTCRDSTRWRPHRFRKR